MRLGWVGLALLAGVGACGGDDDGEAIGAVPPATTTDTDPPHLGPCDGGAVKPGCPCADEDEGVFEPCGRVTIEIAGQKTCGDGQMVCENGKWGECIINNAPID